jgi:hypothetical protein
VSVALFLHVLLQGLLQMQKFVRDFLNSVQTRFVGGVLASL